MSEAEKAALVKGGESLLRHLEDIGSPFGDVPMDEPVVDEPASDVEEAPPSEPDVDEPAVSVDVQEESDEDRGFVGGMVEGGMCDF